MGLILLFSFKMILGEPVTMNILKFLLFPLKIFKFTLIDVNIYDCFRLSCFGLYNNLFRFVFEAFEMMQNILMNLIDLIVYNSLDFFSLLLLHSRVNFVFYLFSRMIIQNRFLSFIVILSNKLVENLRVHQASVKENISHLSTLNLECS